MERSIGNENGITLHVYGDSVLKGIVMDRESGQYAALKEDDFAPLAAAYGIQVTNKAKFGYTVTRGWAFLSRALEKASAASVPLCDRMILEFGGNDCNFDWKAVSDHPEEAHQPMTPRGEFAETLKEMIAALRENGVTPILVSLPPIHAKRYFDRICASTPGVDPDTILAWLGGDTEMIYRYQELYSQTVTRVAYETGCSCIDLRSAFLDKHNYSALLCDDGIHPNEAGHRLIAETLLCADELFCDTALKTSLPA